MLCDTITARVQMLLELVRRCQRFVHLLGAVIFIGLILGLGAPAWATAIYTYTGNPFITTALGQYTTSDSVKISMTLLFPFGPNTIPLSVSPTSLTMTDGVQSLSLATPECF